MQSAQGKAKGRVVFPHLNSPLPSQKIPLSPPRAFLGANPRFGEHFPDLGAEIRGSRGARAGVGCSASPRGRAAPARSLGQLRGKHSHAHCFVPTHSLHWAYAFLVFFTKSNKTVDSSAHTR